jgi:small GTP-binding protein
MNTSIYEQIPNVKIVLLGESTVGKTSIINVVHGGSYIQDQPTTIGACFYIKKMKIDNVTVKLHIWDTAGQERFRSLAPMYYRDAQYALIVFAVDNTESFKAVQSWYKGLATNCLTMPNVILIGNKIDLEDERCIEKEQAVQLAQQLKAQYYEVSAKMDKPGVDLIFEKIACETVKEAQTIEKQSPNTTNVIPQKKKTKKGCC